MMAGTIFSLEIIKGENKARSMQEVQNNANFIIEKIIKTVRQANDIDLTASIFETTPGKLGLTMANSAENPTVFYVDPTDNSLRIKQGETVAQKLSSSEIEITNLVFRNLSTAKSQPNIKINLEVTYKNPNNLSDFNAVFNLEQAVSIRK
jgi:hypothetical protein